MKWRGILLILWLILWLISCEGRCADGSENWQAWERAVRDGRLSGEEGRKAMEAWEERLAETYPAGGLDPTVCFPLRGYGLKDAGGRAGEGYRPSGYDFLDGNRHRGHPAQDIFIRDRNRDGLEDGTERPVDVLALADGVVLSAFREWREGGEAGKIRGGNYVWLYHPGPGVFSYYAHLQGICVGAGERVRCGQKLATLGRTGKNAWRPGSATHLHLMVLRLKGMKPVDSYPILKSKIWPPLEE